MLPSTLVEPGRNVEGGGVSRHSFILRSFLISRHRTYRQFPFSPYGRYRESSILRAMRSRRRQGALLALT